LFDEQEVEGEAEASADNVFAEDFATKFKEGYEMSLSLLWANIKLPASLIMNMEAEKSEEDARQIFGQLRGFGFVRGPCWRDSSRLVLSHNVMILRVLRLRLAHVSTCTCMCVHDCA
ncbi:MAG: hypothetical protein ACKPKO_31205, partial [Candidatus Fonsibacter sp.]